MSALARLGIFGALLVLVFAGAAGAGAVIDVDRADEPAGEAAGHGGEMGAMAADPVRGLAVSDAGLTLELAAAPTAPGRAGELAFRITGKDGRVVRDFDVEHTKRMHLIVVRRDTTGFQHLHPEQRPDGTWTTPVTLPEAGTYRVYADFYVGGEARTLATDLTLGGDVRPVPLPAPASDDVSGDLRVHLDEGATSAGETSELRFTVTRGGEPVRVEDYLGAKGHLVALREGDLAYLHVHAEEDRLAFEATFPTAGRYRLFLQVQVEGRLHTVEFTQEVSR